MRLEKLLKSLPKELKRDGELILAHLLRVRTADLPLLLESEVPPEVEKKFRELIEKRKRGTPTAYLLGEWDFYGRTFKVREGVLIPRPETEILVEKVLENIPEEGKKEGLEIGGGTGCIAITLLLERPHLRMSVVEINDKAVELMEENARLHGVSERMEVLKGDMFEPVKGRSFDFIVSNPPYIPEYAWEKLPEEVRREGYSSLIGGPKGYEFYERFSLYAKDHLKEGGFVALEIGHDQGEVVKRLLEKAGLGRIIIFKDYAGQDRVVLAWN